MKPSLQNDVDRGLEIVAQIEELNEELKAIKARLTKAAAEGPQIPLEDAERDGMQYLARGSGQIVPVILTADCLIKTFQAGSEKHAKIEALAHGQLDRFFTLEQRYERVIDDGKLFRRHAREILGDHAAAFIHAIVDRKKDGVAKSAIKIEWDRAKPVVEGGAA